MKLILLFLLFSSSVYTKGQAPANTYTNQNRAEKLCDSAVDAWRANDYDRALQIANEALYTARQQNDSIQTGRCLINIGLIYSSKGDAVKSIFYYEQALVLLRNLNDRERLHTTLLNLGISYKEQAIYDKALRYLSEACDYFKESGNLKSLASAYNTIGNIFMLEKSYDKALEFHRQALQLRREIKYEEGIAGSLNNIGIVYKKINKSDSALLYFDAALKLKKNYASPGEIATTLSHIADIYIFQEKYTLAEQYYMLAYHLRDSIGNKKGIAHSLYELGNLNFTKNNYKKSELYLKKCIERSKEIKAADVLLRCYEVLRKLYRKTGNDAKALTYDDLYILQYEQQLGEENHKALAQMQVRYETEKKQNEIEQLNKIKEKRDAMLLAQQLQLEAKQIYSRNLIILIILLSLIVILFFILFKDRQRFAKKSQSLAKKLDEVMREMHHRIKNNFQILLSLFSLQKEYIEDEKTREMILSNINRITAMSLIHQELYINQDLTKVKMEEYIQTLIDSLLTAYELKNRNIKVICNVDGGINMEVDKAISLGLLINELVTNAFKYAFGDDNPNPVLTVILANSTIVGNYELTIKDNGNKNNDNTVKSFGLKMVDSQIKRLKGTVLINTKNGTEYIISF